MDNENIETILFNWLKTKAGDYELTADLPKGERPDRFITMDRQSGGRHGMVLDRATMVVEIYNRDSRLEASEKANEIADSVRELLKIDNVTHAEVNSIAHLDDLIGGYHRYQVYMNIYHRR